MLTEFNAGFRRPADRIDSWRMAVSENLVHVECRLLSPPSEFDGSFVVYSSDQCGLACLRGSPHTASRTRASVRQTGDDFFMLFLQRTGRMVVEIEDGELEVRPGDFYFYNARMPHKLMFDSSFEHIALRIPDCLIKDRWGSLGLRGCFQLTPQDPLARIAAATLDAAEVNIHWMSSGDLSIVVEKVVDLFSASASKVRPMDESWWYGGASAAFVRAQAVIQAKLRDEALCPDMIAADMHISRRSLNKLFQRNGVGVMEYVMLQRLERAARDLSSPSQRMVPISQIAYRWGFKNISHFCKRFRDRFGQAPGEVRGR
jgi:AraC family transcriptional activator of tynA and feaB